jgi:hypothetical protein
MQKNSAVTAVSIDVAQRPSALLLSGRTIHRRRLLAASAALGFPSLTGLAAPAEMPWELQQTFYTGTFFDPSAPAEAHLSRYLVRPMLAANNLRPAERLRGHESTASVKQLIRQDGRLEKLLKLSVDSDQGNPVAIYISRAQHDSYVFRESRSAAPRHVTVISLALSLDIFTELCRNLGDAVIRRRSAATC